MHIIDDAPNGIIVNHASDWSGEARVAWYDPSNRDDADSPDIASPRGLKARGLKECHCVGLDLVAGRFTLTTGSEPPVDVMTRAVALAVATFLCDRMVGAAEALSIDRRRRVRTMAVPDPADPVSPIGDTRGVSRR